MTHRFPVSGVTFTRPKGGKNTTNNKLACFDWGVLGMDIHPALSLHACPVFRAFSVEISPVPFVRHSAESTLRGLSRCGFPKMSIRLFAHYLPKPIYRAIHYSYSVYNNAIRTELGSRLSLNSGLVYWRNSLLVYLVPCREKAK